MTGPNPVDYLKYVAAEANTFLHNASNQLSGICFDHPDTEANVERAQDMLAAVRAMITEATAVFCQNGSDFDTYSDGRPVRSSIELELGNVYEHIWHPYPEHRLNRPQTVLDRHECTSGARHSVTISGAGILDTIDHGPGLRLVSGSAEGDQPT